VSSRTEQQKADINNWFKDVIPAKELRTWYQRNSEKIRLFRQKKATS
jgi:uncharacterized protein YeaO (DUF488 family)